MSMKKIGVLTSGGDAPYECSSACSSAYSVDFWNGSSYSAEGIRAC